MIQAFEEGIDIHRLTASMIYGVTPEEVTNEQRDWGKRANHGLNYDLGYKSFAVYYQIEEAEARFIVERYHQIYGGVRRWHARIRDELQRTRALVNLYGRKRIFMDRWGYDMFKEAYSFIPQSTVAELMNQSGVRFVYERQDLFPEVELLNTVHDSLIYQVPLKVGPRRIAEIILQVKENLEKPLRYQDQEFSVPVDTKVGFSLGEDTMTEIKAKDAVSLEAVAERVEACINGRETQM
jgi:DNA polymerase I-like protein with 3'-5' exonuclease and polymerase domains